MIHHSQCEARLGKEKLVLALEMTEGIAVLHGYSRGVIFHEDMQLPQYLLDKDKKILKINDFNRAEFILFDKTSPHYVLSIQKWRGKWCCR